MRRLTLATGGLLLVLLAPTAEAAPPASGPRLAVSTLPSPVPLSTGGWTGDGRRAELELELLPALGMTTTYTAEWTSIPIRPAPGDKPDLYLELFGGFSSGSGVTDASTSLRQLLRWRQVGGKWSRWETLDDATIDSPGILAPESKVEGQGTWIGFLSDDACRACRVQYQLRLTGTHTGGTSSSVYAQTRAADARG